MLCTVVYMLGIHQNNKKNVLIKFIFIKVCWHEAMIACYKQVGGIGIYLA